MGWFGFGGRKEKQTNTLIELGLHDQLGISEQSYRESIPPLIKIPRSERWFHSLPVLVEPRLVVDKIIDASPVGNFLANTPGSPIVEVVELDGLASAPYWIWCNVFHVEQKGLSAVQFNSVRYSDQRGLCLTEGIFLASHYFKKIRRRKLTLPGTVYDDRTGNAVVPILEPSLVGLTVDYFDAKRAHPEFHCASCYWPQT